MTADRVVAPGLSAPPGGRAVVLGGGGVVGTAWMAGLIGGLRHHGIDLSQAELTVGTSAGAIVGAMLATGMDLDALAAPRRTPELGTTAEGVDPNRLAEVLAVLSDPGVDPEAARRRVGRIALVSPTDSAHAHMQSMGSLITAHTWPERPLLITTVDFETGTPQVWDRHSGVSLVDAVAASTAMPGVYPPITLNGRLCMDGGLRSATNADLAAGADALVVLEPLAHLFPSDILRRELAAAHAKTELVIRPDSAAVDAFGPDLHGRATWQAVFRAGTRQSRQIAAQLRHTWG